MKNSGRYRTSHLIEDQFEPGSRGRVLKNLLNIKSRREMDVIETEYYARALPQLIGMFAKTHRFTAKDICLIHEIWLGDIYAWAGQYRQVNISKDGFHFAASQYIPKMMVELERGILKKHTPCIFKSDDKIITALAVVHAELMLIHPFREGNGRVGRLLAVLMAFQAGLPGLDFSDIKGKKRKAYFTAIQASAGHDYRPMESIFNAVLLKTKKKHGEGSWKS